MIYNLAEPQVQSVVRIGYRKCNQHEQTRREYARTIEKELREHGYIGFKISICADTIADILEPVRITV